MRQKGADESAGTLILPIQGWYCYDALKYRWCLTLLYMFYIVNQHKTDYVRIIPNTVIMNVTSA